MEPILKVIPIKALKDNYIWCIVDATSHDCIIVDPGDANPVLEAIKQHALKPCAIFITHHHYDHTGGISPILSHYPVPVFGSFLENIAQLTHPLYGENEITLLSTLFKIIDIPGHTLGHIAYYGNKMLFCGDTLFIAGCGRVFEGTMAQMYASLQKIASLPDETLIYCAHEYTQANLYFAKAVEPDHSFIEQKLQQVLKLRAQNLPTVPSTLAVEKMINPFLRCHEPAVIKAASRHCKQPLANPVDVFTVLREWKNEF